MNRPTVVIVLLAVTLLGTNAWWLYRTIDFGITHTYAMASCEDAFQELAQVRAILPVIARPTHTREEVLAAARLDPTDEPFEKDGVVWVGQLGLRFSADGRFVEIVDASK